MLGLARSLLALPCCRNESDPRNEKLWGHLFLVQSILMGGNLAELGGIQNPDLRYFWPSGSSSLLSSSTKLDSAIFVFFRSFKSVLLSENLLLFDSFFWLAT